MEGLVVQANWLHVSERRDKLIHRIHLPDETAFYWSVNSRYLTMSLNKKGNIVVSCYDLHKIFEYTPIGTCVREIQVNRIESAIIGMQHVIQLDEDRFLICHSTLKTSHRVYHRVCITRIYRRLGIIYPRHV